MNIAVWQRQFSDFHKLATDSTRQHPHATGGCNDVNGSGGEGAAQT
jgi:hypothetical protein